MRLSVVIPILNDAPALSCLLADLAPVLADPVMEVIVVDGGSQDCVEAVIAAHGAELLRSRPGRGEQLATGVEATSGQVVWLLHADTRLPPGAYARVADQSSGWGRFHLRFEPEIPGIRMVARMMGWRSRLTGICTGDQGMWVTRDLLERAGGVPRQPLMEDIELSARLRRLAAPTVLPDMLVTSSRRWRERGLVRTILTMWWFRLCYFLGVPAAWLSRSYADVRSRDPAQPERPMQEARAGEGGDLAAPAKTVKRPPT